MSTYGKARRLTKLTDLLTHMQGRLAGCPPALMISTLHSVARSFCRDTGMLKERIGKFDFVADQDIYTIELPYLASVLFVHKVYIDGLEQHPCSYTISCDGDGTNRIQFASCPATSRTEAWELDVSMIPNDGCDEYPFEFLQLWGEAIVAGSLYELMLDEGKRWGNLRMAQHYAQKYSLAKQDAGYRRLSASSRDGRPSFQNDETFAGSF